jgi:Na+/proline symporter
VAAYVVLALPYTYRSVDTGLAAIDVRTLTEAAQSLGAGWGTILLRVIFPNLRSSLLSGAFLTLATHGTDHYLVQRLLAAGSRRQATIGLVLSGFLVLAQFALFLFLGTLFWAYYGGRSFARGDEVLPTFVSAELSGPLVGFILAAIVAAAMSPSLNSMASTTVRDFYLPYVRRDADEARQMRVGRFFTVFWGLAQMLLAVAAQNVQSALDKGLAALSYASGPTVGAFLLGVLTRSATSAGTIVGMLTGLLVTFSWPPGPGWPDLERGRRALVTTAVG